jgi:hypothetical protein
MVDLISNTKTRTGLKIKAKLTQRTYPTGVKIFALEIAKLNLIPEVFHGAWNYSVPPSRTAHLFSSFMREPLKLPGREKPV